MDIFTRSRAPYPKRNHQRRVFLFSSHELRHHGKEPPDPEATQAHGADGGISKKGFGCGWQNRFGIPFWGFRFSEPQPCGKKLFLLLICLFA